MEARKCPVEADPCPVRQFLARQAEAQASQRQSLNQYLEKTLSDFPPPHLPGQATATNGASFASSCQCTRTRPSSILEQFVGGGRKQEKRLLVPDLATDWFRKQKVFLDKISPEEMTQNQDQERCFGHLDVPEEQLAETRCSCPATKRSQGSMEGQLGWSQSRVSLARQRHRQLQGKPTCGCRTKAKEEKDVSAGEEEQRHRHLGKAIAASHSVTHCKTHVAGCGTEENHIKFSRSRSRTRIGMGSRSRSKSRSRSRSSTRSKSKSRSKDKRLNAGSQSPHRRSVVRRSSCTCLRRSPSCRCPGQMQFQSDGQPMSRECQLATRRTEPLMPCLRRKYELQRAPQRRLEPQHFRRISPEFFAILKKYEEAMTESCPLYGISIRHWGESAPCCICEEADESPEHMQCLGDQSVHAAGAVPSIQYLLPSESDTEEYADAAEYPHVEKQDEAAVAAAAAASAAAMAANRNQMPCGDETCPARRLQPPPVERPKPKEKPKETKPPKQPEEPRRKPEMDTDNEADEKQPEKEPEKKKSGFKCCSCWSKDPLKDDEDGAHPKDEKPKKEKKEKPPKEKKPKKEKKSKKSDQSMDMTNSFPAQAFLSGFAGLCRRCVRSGRHLLYSHNSSYQRIRRQNQGYLSGCPAPAAAAAAPPPIPYRMQGVCQLEPAVWHFEQQQATRQQTYTDTDTDTDTDTETTQESCSSTTLRPCTSCECCPGRAPPSDTPSCDTLCQTGRSQAGACNLDGCPSSAIWTLQKRSSRPLKRRFVNENFGRRRLPEQIRGGEDGRLRDENTSSFVEGFCLKVNKHGTRACYLANDYLQLMKMVARKRARYDCLKTKKTTCRPKAEPPTPRPSARSRRISPGPAQRSAAAAPQSTLRQRSAGARTQSAGMASHPKRRRAPKTLAKAYTDAEESRLSPYSDGPSSSQDLVAESRRSSRKKSINSTRSSVKKRPVRGTANSSSPSPSSSPARLKSRSARSSSSGRNVERKSSSPTRSARSSGAAAAAARKAQRTESRRLEAENVTCQLSNSEIEGGYRSARNTRTDQYPGTISGSYPEYSMAETESVPPFNQSNSYPSECLCKTYSYSKAGTTGTTGTTGTIAPQEPQAWSAEPMPKQDNWAEQEEQQPAQNYTKDSPEWMDMEEKKEPQQQQPSVATQDDTQFDANPPEWREEREPAAAAEHPPNLEWNPDENQPQQQHQQQLRELCHKDCPYWRTVQAEEEMRQLQAQPQFYPQAGGYDQDSQWTSTLTEERPKAKKQQLKKLSCSCRLRPPLRWIANGFTSAKRTSYNEGAAYEREREAAAGSSVKQQRARSPAQRPTMERGRRYYTETQPKLWYDQVSGLEGMGSSIRSSHSRCSIRALSSNTETMACPGTPAPSMASEKGQTDRWGIQQQLQMQQQQQQPPQRETPPMHPHQPQIQMPMQPHQMPPQMHMPHEMEQNRYMPYEHHPQQQQQQQQLSAPYNPLMSVPGVGPGPVSLNFPPLGGSFVPNKKIPTLLSNQPLDLKHSIVQKVEAKKPKWMHYNHAPLTLRTARPRAEAYYESKMRRRCLKFMLSIEQDKQTEQTAPEPSHELEAPAAEQEDWSMGEEQEQEQELDQEPFEEVQQEEEPAEEGAREEEQVWFGEPGYDVDEGPQWSQTRRSVSGSMIRPANNAGIRIEHPSNVNQWQYLESHRHDERPSQPSPTYDPYYREAADHWSPEQQGASHWQTPQYRPKQQSQPQPPQPQHQPQSTQPQHKAQSPHPQHQHQPQSPQPHPQPQPPLNQNYQEAQTQRQTPRRPQAQPQSQPKSQPQSLPQPLSQRQQQSERQPQRQEHRQGQRQEQRQPQRQEHHQEQRQEQRQDPRQEQRQPQRQDHRQEQRQPQRQDPRQDQPQRQPRPEQQPQPVRQPHAERQPQPERQPEPHLRTHRQPSPQPQPQPLSQRQRQPLPQPQLDNNARWHWRIPRSVSETRPFYDEEEEPDYAPDEERQVPKNWQKNAAPPPTYMQPMHHSGVARYSADSGRAAAQRSTRRSSRHRTPQRQGGGTAGAITAAALGLRGLVQALGGPRYARKPPMVAGGGPEAMAMPSIGAGIQTRDYSEEQLPFTVEPPAAVRRGAPGGAAAGRSYGYPVQERPSAFLPRSSRFSGYSKPPPPPAMDNERSSHLSLFAVPTSSSNLAWRAEARAARTIARTRMPGGQEQQPHMPPPVSILSDLDFHTHSISGISSPSTSGGYRAPLPSTAHSEDGSASLSVFLDNLRARNVLLLPSKPCPLSGIPPSGSGAEQQERQMEVQDEPTKRRRWLPATPLVIPPTYNALLEEQILQEYLPTPKCRRPRS